MIIAAAFVLAAITLGAWPMLRSFCKKKKKTSRSLRNTSRSARAISQEHYSREPIDEVETAFVDGGDEYQNEEYERDEYHERNAEHVDYAEAEANGHYGDDNGYHDDYGQVEADTSHVEEGEGGGADHDDQQDYADQQYSASYPRFKPEGFFSAPFAQQQYGYYPAHGSDFSSQANQQCYSADFSGASAPQWGTDHYSQGAGNQQMYSVGFANNYAQAAAGWSQSGWQQPAYGGYQPPGMQVPSSPYC